MKNRFGYNRDSWRVVLNSFVKCTVYSVGTHSVGTNSVVLHRIGVNSMGVQIVDVTGRGVSKTLVFSALKNVYYLMTMEGKKR